MSLYLPQNDCNIQELWSNGLDRYSTPLSPLFHLILMEWCVYKHQEWYPLYCERILHFSQCLQSVVRLLGCGLCLHHSSSVQHHQTNVFGSWVKQIGIQNVFGQLVCVEAGFRQRRKISKLLCDHHFRLREVCRKTDYLYSAASFYFLQLVLAIHCSKKAKKKKNLQLYRYWALNWSLGW